MDGRTPQPWYSPALIAQMLGFSVATVREWIRAGKFGSGPSHVVWIGSDCRVSAVGWASFFSNHASTSPPPPVFARSVGELKRKVEHGN
jgi:hypothetical protein